MHAGRAAASAGKVGTADAHVHPGSLAPRRMPVHGDALKGSGLCVVPRHGPHAALLPGMPLPSPRLLPP